MEDKIKLIDEIVERHPSCGVERGWSHYTGGMKDSGDWYFRKMLDVPYDELYCFLKALKLEEAKPRPPRDKSPRIEIAMNNSINWISKAEYDALKKFRYDLAISAFGFSIE